VAWTINRERIVVLGWSAAVLMQLAHPLVTAGVAEHSVAVAQPRMRLRRARETIASMLALTFGTPDETAHCRRRSAGPMDCAGPPATRRLCAPRPG